MNPLLLTAALAALVVVPLVLIAVFAVIGRIFSAPRRFASIVFLILFVIVLAGAAFGYYRAGTVSTAAVTTTSERVVLDDALRARHEFTLTVQVPDLGSRSIAVPARVYDQVTAGQQVQVRAGTLLGVQLARAEGEHLADLVPLGSLACAIGVVLLVAVAAAAKRARAPSILLMLALLAGTGVQPAIEAATASGSSVSTTAIVTGTNSVGAQGAPLVPVLGYLRGPFSIDHRWMWADADELRFVAVRFTPPGASAPITAVDVVPAPAATTVPGQPIQLSYRTSDPRRITLPGSAAGACAWILLGVIAAVLVLLLLTALMRWRWRRRSRRRAAARNLTLDRDLGRDLAASTRREPATDAPSDAGPAPQPALPD